MRKLIIANWKMNPATHREAIRLFRPIVKTARGLKRVEAVVCPPALFLASLLKVGGPGAEVVLGAQNIFWEKAGAYTGEVSAPMLASMGARYAVVGHSERRLYFHENDEAAGKKLLAAFEGGLVPILCVGEWTRKGRSMKETENFVRKQLIAAFEPLKKIKNKKKGEIVVAYEPVWAISTMASGVADTPENARRMIAYIRKLLSSFLPFCRVIYGGSVNLRNAESFLRYPEVEGALVGGASLRAGEFSAILKIAEKCV